ARQFKEPLIWSAFMVRINRILERIEYKQLLFLTCLFWFLAWILGRNGYFPFNDDWAYVLSVEHSLQAHALRLSQGVAATAIFQVARAYIFSRIFGFSYTVLLFSNLTLVWIGLLAFYHTLRRLGASPSTSLAAVLSLFFNPLFFHLSFSFMTDASTLALMM